MKGIILVLLSICVSIVSWGQNSPDDLHASFDEWIFEDIEKAREYADKELAASKKNSPDEVRALTDIATCIYYEDNYKEGRKFLTKAIKIGQKIKDKEGVAWAEYHFGDLTILEGAYSESIEHLNKALALFKVLTNGEGAAYCVNALGQIHMAQGNYKKAQESFMTALKTGSDITKGDSYINLAQLYSEMDAINQSFKYAKLAYQKGIENEDMYVQASALDFMGAYEVKKGLSVAAQKHLRLSAGIKEILNDQKGAALTFMELARLKMASGDRDSVYYFARKAYSLSNSVGAREESKSSSWQLSKLMAQDGIYDSAFFYQSRYVDLNEALLNENASKKMAELEAAAIEKDHKHRISMFKQQQEIDRKNKFMTFLFGLVVLIVLIGVVVVVYNRYRLKKKSLEELERKNAIINEQNVQIMESIRYAKRLQDAILPDWDQVHEVYPSADVMYIPKDIIAGDFYWFNKRGEWNYLACCDCTGHGVPGAMVSVVCSNALNQAVRVTESGSPGEILTKARKIVIRNLNKSVSKESDVKDGMDISLIAYKDGTNEIYYAAAHHSVWLVRKGQKEMEQFRGIKQPIGVFVKNEPYPTGSFQIEKGDRIYLTTDGIADQFGGPDGKKLKSKTIVDFLLSIQQLPMEEHLPQLKSYFLDWKGEEEQLDDVTVLALEW